MTEHSILSPSSFPRLVACPGSRKLEAMFPREESEAADEGILAHEFASERIKLSYRMIHEFSFDVTAKSREMFDAVMLYVEHVFDICKINLPHIEERIDIPYLHPECFGTPDCWYYDEEKNEVHVWDFKYGFKPVEAIDNWQLIGYASGVLSKIAYDLLNRAGMKYGRVQRVSDKIDLITLNLHIVQPRARHRDGSIRTWKLTQDALHGYEDILKAQIEKSFLENPPLAVGSHCTYCKAKSICPALKKESNMIVDKELESERELKSSKIYMPDPKAPFNKKEVDAVEVEYSTEQKEINPNFVAHVEKSIIPDCKIIDTSQWNATSEEWKKSAHELIMNVVHEKIDSGEIKQEEQDITLEQSILDTRRSIEILKLRLESLEKQALETIQSGIQLQGFTVKKVWGRLGWTIPSKDVQLLGNELGLNLVKPAKTEVITPLQAIKLAKKDEAIKERIKSLASCKFNGFKLVAEDEVSDDDEVNFDDL